MVKRLKAVYGLRVAVVSNEGREIAEDRIQRFNLKEFVDFFIVSAFVHIRKPDLDIVVIEAEICGAREVQEVIGEEERRADRPPRDAERDEQGGNGDCGVRRPLGEHARRSRRGGHHHHTLMIGPHRAADAPRRDLFG